MKAAMYFLSATAVVLTVLTLIIQPPSVEYRIGVLVIILALMFSIDLLHLVGLLWRK